MKLKGFMHGAMAANETRAAAAATKILETYPDSQSCARALYELAQKCPHQKRRAMLLLHYDNLNKEMSREKYGEYVRKYLAGSSGFWKTVAWILAIGATASFVTTVAAPLEVAGILGTLAGLAVHSAFGYRKAKDAENIIKGKTSANDIMNRFGNGKKFFR